MMEYMNSKTKHGELSSAMKSLEHKTKNRIQSPSEVFRAARMCDLYNRISFVNTCPCFGVLFGNISDLSKNFARSSGIRLRALLNDSCKSTDTYFKTKI